MGVSFKGDFECGNFSHSEKITENHYRLFVSKDPASGRSFWFYFSLSGASPGSNITFEVCNLTKDSSLFNKGALPYVKVANGEWNVVDGKANQVKTMRDDGWNTEYTVKFSHHFVSCEVHFFATSIPYGYTDLQNDLSYFDQRFKNSGVCMRQRVIGSSISGRDVILIQLSNREVKRKSNVMISCRVHPGESVASWVLRGLLLFLSSESSEATELFSLCQLSIIPMLNPDGVAMGFFRGSVKSRDLNREWREPSMAVSPTITTVKRFISSLHKEEGIELFCDLHGHATCTGSFLYGNKSAQQRYAPPAVIPWQRKVFLQELDKVSGDLFSGEQCSFDAPKYAAARNVLFKELGIDESFTFETSYHGYTCEDGFCPFNRQDLEQTGRCIGLALIGRFR